MRLETSDGIGSAGSPLDRERIALIEVGQTDVSPRLARGLVIWFLAVLALLPALEIAAPARAAGEDTPWTSLAAIPSDASGRVDALLAQSPASGAWDRLVAANRAALAGFTAFESALEDRSSIGRLLRPPTQQLLSGWLGAGNERVYIGEDGWLFYRPDVESLTGPGFLDVRTMERRVAAAAEHETPPAPDPRPAIRQFARDLEARGITLVLMPTPVKASIHPERLASDPDIAARVPLHNASYASLLDELANDGVLVFDPSPHLTDRRASAPAYLATDTHWRPESMQRVAEALAGFLHTHAALPPVPAPGYAAERREARHHGDTAVMLDLPEAQTLYPPERVTLRFVTDASGDPWRPSRDADVLVLGDSFSNIYSLPSMGWGEAAGFVEQLSLALQRPLDRIVLNDDGAYATRLMLQRELGGGTDRLTGKRIVVWQFAARELAFGDWRVLPLRGASGSAVSRSGGFGF